jgi:hypothetical protein
MLKEKLLSIFDRSPPTWLYFVSGFLILAFWGLNGYWRWKDLKEYQQQIELRNTLIRDKIEKMNCTVSKNGNWICEDERMECFSDGKAINCKVRLNDGQKVNAKF